MGLFSRKPRTAVELAGLPAGFSQTVAQLGRQSVLGPGFPSLSPDIVVMLWQLSERDRSAFYAVLTESAEQHGGWGWVGAAWVAKDIGPTGYQSDAAHDVIMEAATSFLRTQQVSLLALPPIQQDWWFSRHPGEDWLPS